MAPGDTDEEELKKAENAKGRESEWLREFASGMESNGAAGVVYVNCGRWRSGGLISETERINQKK